MVDVRPAPVPTRRKPSAGRSVLRVIGAALAGLVGTPIVYYLIGSILYGHRSSWSVGQGEGFRVFLIAIGAAPVAAVYWGILAARFEVLRAGPRSWWIALGVYLLAGFVLHLALDPGP
jgi:hypothetical protein